MPCFQRRRVRDTLAHRRPERASGPNLRGRPEGDQHVRPQPRLPRHGKTRASTAPPARVIPIALATALAVAAAVTTQQQLTAHEDGNARKCSVRTLRGDYGLLASGVRLVPFGPNAGKTEMVIGTGLRSYDGNGKHSRRATPTCTGN